MANYPTGVTIVTTNDDTNHPVGLTVNSFASVSLDPLLILWSIGKQAFTYEIFKNTDRFAVNILAHDQAAVAGLFASRLAAQEKFAGCNWHQSEQQLPVIEDAVAVLQCKTFKQVEAGDHLIFIGEVIAVERKDELPLLYHKRKMSGLPSDFHENTDA